MSKIKKKKKKTFLWLIFIKLFPHALLSDALQFTSQVLHQMKGLIKLYNPDKFLETSNFRDLQILAQQSFWTYFEWFLMEFVRKLYQWCNAR